jgi:hypothetical protein
MNNAGSDVSFSLQHANLLDITLTSSAHLVQPLNWYYTSQKPYWLQNLHISLWTQVQLPIEHEEGSAKLMQHTQIQGSAKHHGLHGQASNKTVCLFP